ncbi:unnamed protein product [Orchesella dallaii]|uniref:Uncharacterized protein n=1 Tax=Orchesella dallaii TaxID=48710 RepID=A0ABP1QSN6_9HEXA
MKKKRSKTRRLSDEGSEATNLAPDGANSDEYRQPKKTKSRLRRRRDSYAEPDSDSDASNIEARRKRRKRKKRGGSKTPAATTEESSEWDDAGSRVRKGSKATLADEKEKTKEITEKDLVARMQRLIPYLPPDSPLWTKWTLGPLYYFIRRAQSTLVIAICLNSLEKSTKNNKNNTNTTSNNSHPTTSSKVLNRLLRICKPINGTSFITFNQLIPDYKGDFFYFVKASRVKLEGFNYDDMVVCGNVSSSHIASLNSLLLHLWTPLLLEKEFIPDGIKDELLTDLNTISCSCRTITHAQESGQLLLFVPQESYLDERSDMELSKDKEFCVRLEETIVYWLTKLKEVLILKELNDSEGWPAPLDEVQFWKLRSKNLEEVLSQVRSNTVKKTLRILALSRSPYIEELQKISKKLIQSWSEASSNAHYLKTLLPICYRLPRLRLKEIPDEIQKYLWLTLIIWRNSSHYNSSKRLNGLLRKFSNAIIIECRKRIKVNFVLEGKVISTGQMMRNCLKCLNWWKEKFATTEAMHLARYPDITWIFNYDQIFTHVDSMIHRLKDLLEICETQKLYGRKIDDTEEREPLPLYPGTRGLYITKVMKSIENNLNSKLNELFSVSHLCLDVKSIEWHAHMQSFKETVLSIEMTIQNLLEETFDQMSNLQQKLELLQLFFKFYTREIISRQIDKLTILLFEYFEAEVLRLRKLFEEKIVPLPMTFSQMAGRGAWASHMKKRLDFNLGMLKKAESWLPKSRFSDIVKQEAKSLSDSISIYAKKTYEEWTTKELEKKDYLSKLKIPLLLRQGRDKKGIVEMNFDRRVYYNLAEAEMWQRVGRAVPLVLLLSIYPLRERLHTLRTNVSAVAKHYNRIVCSLSRDEKLLFRETLLPLEKKIYPCLSEFTWAPDPTLPTTVDHVFLEEFLKLASQIRGSILLYRNANFRIANITFGISNQKMIEINEKIVYTQTSFRAQLNDKILKELKEIMKDYKSICKVLQVALQIFRDDGPAVKIQWGKYVKMIDECVEEALCTSLRSSLEHLANVICSSDKPIFKLELKLDSNLGQIIFEPRLEDLSEMILGVHENIAMAFENLPRVSQFFGTFSPDAKPAVSLPTSFTSTLLSDDVSLGIQDRIRFTIEKCFSELNLYMDRWVPYRDIWELDKEEFVKSYGINNPGVKAYEKDLSKYLELSKVVHGSDSMITVQFCELDCTPFKTGVSEESEKWFHLLANSLYNKPKSTLEGLYEYMESNQRKFSKEPGNIQEQIGAFKLLQNIKAEANQKVLTFPGIQEQFGMLKKFNFNIEPEVQTLADNLGREWKAYLKSLIAADNHLQMSYDKLRTAFLDQDCNFINSVNELVQSYEKEGPFSTTKADAFQLEDGGGPCEKALAQLDHFENKLVLFKQEENELILSLKSFNITKGHNKTLIALETEIGSLRKVWKTVQEWDIHWNQWKIIQVQSLHPEMMNKVAYKFLQVFQKLSKEFEAKSWPVIGETIEFLENFQGSMKTVTFLKNETLRDRHWERIKGIVGSKLDPHSQDFNLETIVSLRLHAYFQEVAEISLASGKETAVENTLKTIEQYWKGEYFGVTHRKGFSVPFQIHCNENLKDSLMDHIVSLSAMKGSQFIEPFLEKIEFWEGTLAKVNQIVDQLLAIQEEWLFMEMVFSDQDIQRELSQQAKHFKNVKSLWGSIVLIITENRNVIMAVNQAEDLKEMLNHLEEQMERLRKELQTILHKKRQEFPRFYFLSDSLLLECLAGSLKRGRNNLGKIIQQMYPNVEKLFLSSQTEESFPPAMKVIDAVICKQGESLQLLKPVEMIGPVESWFENFDFTLKSTVKSNLRSCLENLRQNITRLDLWMIEWPSQSCLTALEIQWTLDVTRALLHISSTVENVVEQSTGEYTLKKISRRLKRIFVKLTEILKEQQNENGGRLKVAGILMTIMYLRDITERLYLRNCSDVNSFEWLQYLRCYWERDTNECLVRQAEASFEYGYEFIGNSERAVITPLTERCFMGLTTALSFHFGAFIYGTSNAGKKETTNELGRKLGMHMVNLSMSSCTDYEHLSRKLIGLVQTGSWGILSHIENCQPEIISFLNDRLSVIMKGKCQNVEKLVLSGFEVNLQQSCAIFVLMRRDAKGNKIDLSGLKSTLRPVALIQPDTKNILDVKLFIGGFDNSTSLAKKLETIFTTARSILCSQNHCNFSLDGMLAVVKQAMEFKTTYGKRLSESESIIKAIQNIVTPALSSEENVIFASLIKDTFPNEEPLKVENAALENMIGDAIKLIGYQVIYLPSRFRIGRI